MANSNKSKEIYPLSSLRLGNNKSEKMEEDRTPYETDADRILFSEAFRALADKTQVHGTTGNDYVRSRLTHSLEVSRVGRSLGCAVAPILLPKLKNTPKDFLPRDVGNILAAACLMHDIGNPPFGHTGEDIISEFFRSDEFGAKLIEETSDRFKTEATHFEGNAQGFRVVSRLQGWHENGGLMLTSATLAAFAKYPFSANPEVGSKKQKHKYGFFETEADFFKEVAKNTTMIPEKRELSWKRHPLAYLVEAADDTCYQIVDLEDAADLGVITFEEAEELMMPIVQPNMKEYRLLDTNRRKLVYLRGKAIGRLIENVVNLLEDDIDQIVQGTHKGDLLRTTPVGKQLDVIEQFSRKYIYANANRKAQDANAEQILNLILKELSQGLYEREKAGGPIRHEVLSQFPQFNKAPYHREGWIRSLCDFISSLTDQGAIETYEKIQNI